MTIRSIFAAALAAAVLGAAALAAAASPSEPPATLAEARALEAKAGAAEPPDWPYYLHPPVNVRMRDHPELFGDRVMVAGKEEGETVPEGIAIYFYGRDGRSFECTRSDWERRPGVHLTGPGSWSSTEQPYRGRLVPFFLVGWPDSRSLREFTWFAPLYDGSTGEITLYRRHKRFWWDWDRGHLQERLPAVTWALCPDFPSAEKLGIGVNRAQTATTYPDLVAQDPGRRVRRPDLVAPGAAVDLRKGNGQ